MRGAFSEGDEMPTAYSWPSKEDDHELSCCLCGWSTDCVSRHPSVFHGDALCFSQMWLSVLTEHSSTHLPLVIIIWEVILDMK